jgi:hypothetical protein
MPNDPVLLSPDQRMREVAAIMAQGVLRLGNLATLSPDPATECQNSAKSAETLKDCLDVSPTSSPHSLTG